MDRAVLAAGVGRTAHQRRSSPMIDPVECGAFALLRDSMIVGTVPARPNPP